MSAPRYQGIIGTGTTCQLMRQEAEFADAVSRHCLLTGRTQAQARRNVLRLYRLARSNAVSPRELVAEWERRTAQWVWGHRKFPAFGFSSEEVANAYEATMLMRFSGPEFRNGVAQFIAPLGALTPAEKHRSVIAYSKTLQGQFAKLRDTVSGSLPQLTEFVVAASVGFALVSALILAFVPS